MDQSDIKARKRDARAEYKRIRSDLGQTARDAADAQIAERVAGLSEWQRAQLVLTYLSIGDEVDTRALIRRAWDEGRTVALPRVAKRAHQMDWYRIEDFDCVPDLLYVTQEIVRRSFGSRPEPASGPGPLPVIDA